MLVRNEPLPSLFPQTYGHANLGVEDFHDGVAIRHRSVGDDSQLSHIERPRPSRTVIKQQFPGLSVFLQSLGLEGHWDIEHYDVGGVIRMHTTPFGSAPMKQLDNAIASTGPGYQINGTSLYRTLFI